MILPSVIEKLKPRAKDDFKGRHFEAWLIIQAVDSYLNSPLTKSRPRDFAPALKLGWDLSDGDATGDRDAGRFDDEL